MQRRQFLAVSAAAAASVLASNSSTRAADEPSARPFFELRRYHFPSAEKQKQYEQFLADAAVPAYNRASVEPVGVFKIVAKDNPALKLKENPTDLYVFLPHKTFESVLTFETRLAADEKFQSDGKQVLTAPKSNPAFTRYESTLLQAMEGAPHVDVPTKAPTRVFELRTYESRTNDRALNKLAMFNAGEFDVFKKANMPGVFYGGAIVGEKLPQLTYMIVHESIEDAPKTGKPSAQFPRGEPFPGIPNTRTTSRTSPTNTSARPRRRKSEISDLRAETLSSHYRKRSCTISSFAANLCTVCKIIHPRHVGPRPTESLQSLPNISLSWCRDKKSRVVLVSQHEIQPRPGRGIGVHVWIFAQVPIGQSPAATFPARVQHLRVAILVHIGPERLGMADEIHLRILRQNLVEILDVKVVRLMLKMHQHRHAKLLRHLRHHLDRRGIARHCKLLLPNPHPPQLQIPRQHFLRPRLIRNLIRIEPILPRMLRRHMNARIDSPALRIQPIGFPIMRGRHLQWRARRHQERLRYPHRLLMSQQQFITSSAVIRMLMNIDDRPRRLGLLRLGASRKRPYHQSGGRSKNSATAQLNRRVHARHYTRTFQM